MGLVWIDFPNLSKKDPSFGKLGHVINKIEKTAGNESVKVETDLNV